MPYAVPKPNHKRRVPKKSKRGNFSGSTRSAIAIRDQGLCRQCGNKGESIHHVVYRSQSGRGVYTNGLTVCHICHDQIHRDKELSDYWFSVFRQTYGDGFWKDEYDE